MSGSDGNIHATSPLQIPATAHGKSESATHRKVVQTKDALKSAAMWSIRSTVNSAELIIGPGESRRQEDAGREAVRFLLDD